MKNDSQKSNVEILDTESRILEAAEKEFLAKGYAGARTTSIAEAAGVNHAMLHYYYRSKEKLFGKVISDKISGLAKTIVINFDDDKATLKDCLRNGIEKHFDFIRKNPELPRFMVNEVFRNADLMDQLREKLQEISDNIVGRLQHKIDSAAEKGLCRRIEARELMMDIISLNVFPILGVPMMEKVTGIDADVILERRKQSNVDTILRKIKP